MRKLSIISLVLCAAGLATLWAGVTHRASEQQFQDFVAGGVALGIGLATIAALEAWVDAPRTMSIQVYYGVGSVIAVFIWLFIKCLGMHQIGGFGFSLITDLGWRTLGGQVPYKDFPCPFPAFSVLGTKFAFQWFGVHWSSIVSMTAIFAFVTFLWSIILVSGLFGRSWFALLVAVTGQITANVFISFWWHNNVSVVACVIYVLSAELWLRRPHSVGAAVSYFASLVFVAGMKPNTAGPLIVLITGYLVVKSQRRALLAGLSVLAYGAFSFILQLNGISQALMIKNYLNVAGRCIPFQYYLKNPGRVEGACFFLAACATVLPALFLLCRNRKAFPAWVIPAIAFVVGFYGYGTDVDLWICLTLMLVALVLMAEKLHSVLWHRYVTWLCMVLSVAGITQAVCRERVKTIGLPLFFEYDGNRHRIKEGYFDGLYCGNIFAEILREESIVVEQARTNTVWFGPIMQWGYAAFNLPSPPMQPVLWVPVDLFAKSDEDMYFDRFMDSRFQTLIFFKHDFLSYSQQELGRIGASYDIDDSFHTLTVAHLKQK
jgi:hypothetical protein